MGAPSKPPLALLALAMAHKAHELQLKRKRGRPRKHTLLGKDWSWKKANPRREACPGRPGQDKAALELMINLVLNLVEQRLKGARTWKAALERIPFTPRIDPGSLLRQARRARKNPRVQAIVLRKHPTAGRFLRSRN
jgi:hypothetical protein